MIQWQRSRRVQGPDLPPHPGSLAIWRPRPGLDPRRQVSFPRCCACGFAFSVPDTACGVADQCVTQVPVLQGSGRAGTTPGALQQQVRLVTGRRAVTRRRTRRRSICSRLTCSSNRIFSSRHGRSRPACNRHCRSRRACSRPACHCLRGRHPGHGHPAASNLHPDQRPRAGAAGSRLMAGAAKAAEDEAAAGELSGV